MVHFNVAVGISIFLVGRFCLLLSFGQEILIFFSCVLNIIGNLIVIIYENFLLDKNLPSPATFVFQENLVEKILPMWYSMQSLTHNKKN